MSGSAPLRAGVAKQSDYRSIARLCRLAVGRYDYVLSILKEVIDNGGLFLAWKGHELVGFTNFDKCIDGSGWLSMARTDPKWRRGGVASFLQRQIAANAHRRGVSILRLWTLSTNMASIHACEKGGFRPVCEAAHISYNQKGPRQVSSPEPRKSVSLSSFQHSKYVSKMNGYFAYKWHFIKADKQLLEKLVRKSEMYSVGDSSFILTKPEFSFHRLHSSFTILDGSFASSLRLVKKYAKGLGVRRLTIGSYIPYAPYELRAARKLAFTIDEWGKHCIVFEKRIGP